MQRLTGFQLFLKVTLSVVLLFLVFLERKIPEERRLVQACVVEVHQQDDRQDDSTVEATEVTEENKDRVG